MAFVIGNVESLHIRLLDWARKSCSRLYSYGGNCRVKLQLPYQSLALISDTALRKLFSFIFSYIS